MLWKSPDEMAKQNTAQDQVPAFDPKLQKALDKNDETSYSTLIDQVQAEFTLAWFYVKPKMDEWGLRLRLYNNQRRDKAAVGDPLLFGVHQTILASLYNDRLAVTFQGREEGDEDTAENLTALAEFDYDDMEKDELDYEWDWDSSFFGRGLLLAMEFSRKLKLPLPEVIDPMTWLRDPRAVSVNGDRKARGAMKFGGREIRLTKDQMKEAGIYSDYEKLKGDVGDITSVMDRNIQARADAQGLSNITHLEKYAATDGDIRLLEWFTTWQGKKVLVTLGDKRTRLVRYQELKRPLWPIIDRAIYPMSHDWDGVSVGDLVEDKQRGRAVVQNLALKGIKLGLEPTYIYNSLLVKNRADLNQQFNKHIAVDGNPNNVIVPVQRQVVKQEAGWIMEVLDQGAQRATATPDIQQGIRADQKRTATELNLQASKVDTRYSLSAKIFGWSERRFWKQWYTLYKDNFKADIDEKIIRVAGAMGAKWRPLTRENIIAETDPDVMIESRVVSDAKRFTELQQYRLWLKDVLAADPQNSNVRFALRKIGRLSGFRRDEVEQIIPPNVDELTADVENEDLNNDKIVMVHVSDDDFIHMQVHNKAADTPVKYAHMNAHRKAMMLKRMKPEFNFAQQAQAAAVAGGVRPGAPPSPVPSFAGGRVIPPAQQVFQPSTLPVNA